MGSYPNANAHKSLDIGNTTLMKMVDMEVSKYTFRKVERIIQIGAKIMIGKEEVVIDPQLLFQRLLIIPNSSDIVAVQLWEYELSIHPLAIITKNGLLHLVGDKANITSYLTQICEPESIPDDIDNLLFESSVLDIGSILHKVPRKMG